MRCNRKIASGFVTALKSTTECHKTHLISAYPISTDKFGSSGCDDQGNDEDKSLEMTRPRMEAGGRHLLLGTKMDRLQRKTSYMISV